MSKEKCKNPKCKDGQIRELRDSENAFYPCPACKGQEPDVAEFVKEVKKLQYDCKYGQITNIEGSNKMIVLLGQALQFLAQLQERLREVSTLKYEENLDENELMQANRELQKEIERLKDILREFRDSPPVRHVPNWVVFKCEQALLDGKEKE